MSKRFLLCASVATLCGHAAVVHAGPPAWCNGKTFDVTDGDLYDLKSGDPERTLAILGKAACSTSDVAEAHRAELESARAAWGAKYGLKDADWLDPPAFNHTSSLTDDTPLVNRSFASLSPIDQYVAIDRGEEKVHGNTGIDDLYMADVLDSQLTETGRLGFLTWCLNDGSMMAPDDHVVRWAACQADMDKFDVAKAFDEIRSDTGHDATARMWARFAAHDMAKRIKENADKKAALIKQDAAYGKIYSVAAKAEAEWAKSVGANAQLLELTRDVESAQFFHSRKLYEGCEDKTAKALADAASKMSARAFAGLTVDFDRAETVIAKDPNVFVAAVAYVVCQPDAPLSQFLGTAIIGAPGARGPRSAAVDAIMATTFTFDDTNKQGLNFPKFWQRPYRVSTMHEVMAATPIASVKHDKDGITVTFASITAKTEDCVKEHRGRLARIREDGTLDYDMICDQTQVASHTYSGGTAVFDAKWEKWLKAGEMIAYFRTSNGNGLIAVWPGRGAKLPSMVLGGAVK